MIHYYCMPGLKYRHTFEMADEEKAQIIKAFICNHFKTSETMVDYGGRWRNLTYVRHLIMYVMKQKTNLTLNRIGALLGGKDHTTVKHGRRVIENYIATDEEKKAEIEYILANCLL